MGAANLVFRAGKSAYPIIREEGLRPDRVSVMAGASGGPKWLVLSGIDRVLPGFFRNRQQPLHLLGSSIGSWRFAAYTADNPADAVAAFEEAYIAQRYSAKPGIAEVTRESVRIMRAYVQARNIPAMLDHPFMRTNFLAVRSRGLGGSDSPLRLGTHLAAAALANAMDRRLLRFFFERALFHDPRQAPPFLPDLAGFTLRTTPLSTANFEAALLASGSIPMVMEGVTGIEGAFPGTYRDGGIIDYHLDLRLERDSERLVLYPHFYDYIIPGWFDKALPRRRGKGDHLDSVLLVAPSREFVASLPHGKIPDRDDFAAFDDRDRLAYWHTVVARGKELGEELMEAITGGGIRQRVLPLSG